MPSNLRSKPIEGHVTDSAGNVLRNSEITIKSATPTGVFPMDTVHADDDGYFRSKPLPSGQYDIYESGIRVAKTIHVANQNPVQCFRAHTDNYDASGIGNFLGLAEAHTLQEFYWFLQIEPDIVDVPVYGSSFPIYERDIKTDPGGSADNTLYNLAEFLGLSANSRITTTRFDIEYYAPITVLASQYRRVRWSGVPAIRFFPDSKLVVPLDLYSVTPNLPKLIAPVTSDFPDADILFTEDPSNVASVTDDTGNNDDFETFLGLLTIGDIVKVVLQEKGEGVNTQKAWYGVVNSTNNLLVAEEWKSSRFPSDVRSIPDTDYFVARMEAFDGLFNGITNINEEVNERFTVVENVSAQDNSTELYTYNNS